MQTTIDATIRGHEYVESHVAWQPSGMASQVSVRQPLAQCTYPYTMVAYRNSAVCISPDQARTWASVGSRPSAIFHLHHLVLLSTSTRWAAPIASLFHEPEVALDPWPIQVEVD